MREIKFRGRCGKHWLGSELYGKWVYGDLIHSARCTISNNSNRMQYFVDEETVGQYTGLKDKNGIEIYEGDIVKCSNGMAHQYKVEFSFGCFEGYDRATRFTKNLRDMQDLEVIGNIYENPELLIDEDLRVLSMEADVYSKKI